MKHWTKRLFAIAAPLLLAGCLWGPGKFASNLTLHKNGTFVLDYRGEIVIQLPPDEATPPSPWNDSMAQCHTDGRAELLTKTEGHAEVTEVPPPDDTTVRPCSPTEIAKLKQQYQQQSADAAGQKRKENEEMAKAFGLPGLDDQSNRAFATKLMKYAGWRSVTYRGKGVFDVDYHFEGSARQDFLFPALPDNNVIIPFIAIRRRSDGSVLVTAPAMTGGSGPLSSGASGGMDFPTNGPQSRAQGRFTVITDGEILTNNSEDGAAPAPIGRQVHWDVSPASTKIPETLIRLQ